MIVCVLDLLKHNFINKKWVKTVLCQRRTKKHHTVRWGDQWISRRDALE